MDSGISQWLRADAKQRVLGGTWYSGEHRQKDVTADYWRQHKREMSPDEKKAWDAYIETYQLARQIADTTSGTSVARRAAGTKVHRKALMAAVQELARERGPLRGVGFGTRVTIRAQRGKENLTSNLYKILGVDGLSDKEQAYATDLMQVREGADPLIEGQPWYVSWPVQAVGMTVEMLPGLAMGSAASQAAKGLGLIKAAGTGRAVAQATGATAFWTGHIYPNEYENLVRKGVPKDRARLTAFASALAQGAIEQLNYNPFKGPLKQAIRGKARKFVKEVGTNYVKELSEETAQAFFSKFSEYLVTDMEDPVKQIVKEMVDQTVAAAGPLMFMMAPGAAVSLPGAVRPEVAGPPLAGAASPEAVEGRMAGLVPADERVEGIGGPEVRDVPKAPAPAEVSRAWTRDQLLKPEGAREFIAAHPEAASEIGRTAARGKTPTRQALDQFTYPNDKKNRWSQAQRRRFAGMVRAELEATTPPSEPRSIAPVPATAEQAPEAAPEAPAAPTLAQPDLLPEPGVVAAQPSPPGRSVEPTKVDIAGQELNDAIAAFGKATIGKTFANPLDPETLKLAGIVVAKAVKLGAYKFADFVQYIVQQLGRERAVALGPALERAWDEAQAGDETGKMESSERVRDVLGVGPPPPGPAGEGDPALSYAKAAESYPFTPEGRNEQKILEEIPEVDDNLETSADEVLEQYHRKRDVAFQEADSQHRRNRAAIMEAIGVRWFGAKAKAADRAIFFYVDLKGKTEQIAKWWSKLTEAQQKRVEASQNLSPALKAVAETIIEQNRQAGWAALDAGAIRNVIDNYLARKWAGIREKLGFKKRTIETFTRSAKFKQQADVAKQRTYKSVLEGLTKGNQLRIDTATDSQFASSFEIAQVIYDRNLLLAGAKTGVISQYRTLKGREDFVEVKHPNFTKWVRTYEKLTHVAAKSMFMDAKGQVFRQAPLFAEPKMAKKLNNMLNDSALKGIPWIDFLSKYNALGKFMTFIVGLFHHQAYIRSYMFGSPGLNPYKAYFAGKHAIENLTPLFRELTAAGLTTGRNQNWDEQAVKEKTRIGELIDKWAPAGEAKDRAVEFSRISTDFLFKNLGPYLKAQAAILEYTHLLKKHQAALEAGTTTREEIAAGVARAYNADFGGLHLARIGRNPTTQHIFRLGALAADWTESNIRTITGAFTRGHGGEVYRAMWARIAVRAGVSTIMFNFLMAAMDDDDFFERLSKAWDEGPEKMRWLDIDISPVYWAMGGDSEKRKYFALIGHFRDPIKFIWDARRSGKHKLSVLGRIAADFFTGEDWAGRKFTSVSELLGVDDKGLYKTTRPGHYYKYQPKGGKLKGRLTAYAPGGGKDFTYANIPSWVLHEARSVLPIPIQQGMAFLSGEADVFDAMSKGLGFMTSTTYPESN